jgi:chemotaxis protein CheD
VANFVFMDKQNKIIDVGMSDMKAATNPHILRSSGIGSCVVVTLYDSQKRIGAMAHPMLALPSNQQSVTSNQYNEKEKLPVTDYSLQVTRDLRFVENAIDTMILELSKMGVNKKQLEAKIVGGANMFKVFDKNPYSIGIHNAEIAQKKLEKEGIKIVANDTGGSVGRSVAFDLTTGLVEVKTKI